MADGPQTPEQMKAELAKGFLRIRELKFQATGNREHAWRAYRLARHLGVPIPDWVLRVLDDVSKDADAKSGSRGGPSSKSQADTDDRNYAILHRIRLMVRGAHVPPTIAIDRVASEYNLSTAAVRNIWYGLWCRPKGQQAR